MAEVEQLWLNAGIPELRIVGELNVCLSVPVCSGLGITPGTALASLGPNQDGLDEEIAFIGHYLVLEPIPLPASLWMLGAALASLAGWLRRRH